MTLRHHVMVVAVAGGVALGAVLSPVPAGAGPVPTAAARPVSAAAAGPVSAPFAQPVWVGDARQILTVRSARPGSSYATVSGWQVGARGWARTFGPVAARVGLHGTTTKARDNFYATPQGTYRLTQAFGVKPAPAATRLPYRRVGPNDWWVSDATSRYYNTWQVGPPRGRWNPAIGERLADYPTAYANAVVIDYNRSPVVKGRGSAIFLHVGTAQATLGCVSVSAGHLAQLLAYLNPAQRPRIAIL